MNPVSYPLTDRLSEAFTFAHARHAARRHFRKGTSIPYVAHLLGVTSLVLEHGGSEVEAMAALLHDIVEDTPTTLDEVREHFGSDVEAIVRVCTDSTVHEEKPPWRPRKDAYLARVRAAPLPARRVVAADKLHNLRAILHDHDRLGDALWPRFTPTPAQTAWYYRAAYDAVTSGGDLPDSLGGLLEQAVGVLEGRVGQGVGSAPPGARADASKSTGEDVVKP